MAEPGVKAEDMGTNNNVQNPIITAAELCTPVLSNCIPATNPVSVNPPAQICTQTFVETGTGIFNNEPCEPLQSIADPENHIHVKPSSRTDFGNLEKERCSDSDTAEKDPLLSVSEGEKENEGNSTIRPTFGKDKVCSDEVSDKVKVYFMHMEGLKEDGSE